MIPAAAAHRLHSRAPLAGTLAAADLHQGNIAESLFGTAVGHGARRGAENVEAAIGVAHRAVGALAEKRGRRQYLDIGLPVPDADSAEQRDNRENPERLDDTAWVRVFSRR